MATVATVPGRAGRLDITIERYTSLALPLHVKDQDTGDPIDLSVYDSGFRMDCRENYASDTILFSLSSANTLIEHTDLGNGDIKLIFPKTLTDDLDRPGIYDLVGDKSSGETERLVGGTIILSEGSTR